VGGEEFGFVLPGTAPAEAVEVAGRLRESIARIPVTGHGPVTAMPARVTVSIGLAIGGQRGWDLGTYYSLADKALYAAKQNGRDAVWAVTGDQEGDLEPRPVTHPEQPPGREKQPQAPPLPEPER